LRRSIGAFFVFGRRRCDRDAVEVGDEYLPRIASLSRLEATIEVDL